MHRELNSIVQLWEHDCLVDSLRAQAASLKAEVDRIGENISTLGDELQALVGQQEEMLSRQGGTQRELDRYVVRRDRSKELLRGGHSLDFGTVQKQLEQCSAKVDELELELLQVMEDRENCSAEILQKEQDRETAQAAKAAAHQRWVAEGNQIRSQLETIWPVRQGAASELTREQLVRYEDFRKRKLVPVAKITGKTCSGCHVVVANHLRMEVSNGKRLHACRGCGRWLLPPDDIGELDEASEGA